MTPKQLLTMVRVAAYVRYSSDNQRDESLDAQIRAIEIYCKQNGYELIKVYADRAKTATSDKRPEFQQMIEDSDKNLFDIVVVHKLDRFSRDKYDSTKYKRKLKVNGIKLLSVTENLDGSPESVILESLLEGMAEYYSKNLAREVMKGMKETAHQCKHTGGLPPIGYSVDPATKKYIVNENERGIVETIFSMFLAGYGYNQIVTALQEKGYRSRYGRPIGKNNLHDILRNEKYTGTYIFNLTGSKDAEGKRNSHKRKDSEDVIRVEGGMPTIVSKELFQQVQAKMDANKQKAGRQKAKELYLLSGLIVCGECLKNVGFEYSLIGNTKYSGRNKLKYVTYRCGNRDQNKDCCNPELRREYVENYVITQLHEKIFNDSAIPTLAMQLSEYQAKKNTAFQAEAARLEKNLRETEKQINNIVNAVASGVSNAALLSKLEDLEAQKMDLEQRILEQSSKKQQTVITEDALRQLLASFKDRVADRNIPEIKKFISSYVEKVIVYKEYVELILKVPVTALEEKQKPQPHAVVVSHGGGEGI
ncbi:Resolvase domain protein [Paenibacillus curdlanolyticus YK9]|uniref:Resolvase domain protein n=1 Tax=Paenibacillus curdlanolyticus YK9 TaxID=717606 RepID=E0ID85_9BACL|nr:recombinase family protein [Paenibacillus curdlanolyticus]EFM09540.1 Resolvase domain protein [Paenibacillus curdlanolyticus YK9]